MNPCVHGLVGNCPAPGTEGIRGGTTCKCSIYTSESINHTEMSRELSMPQKDKSQDSMKNTLISPDSHAFLPSLEGFALAPDCSYAAG